MKLSYVIASMRPEAVAVCIESIERLPTHDHEVVIVTPHVQPDFGNVRFLLDDKFGGSTYAMNKGAQESVGDWILIGTDDHVINYDVYRFLDLIRHPQIEALDYQIINMGAPWTDCLIRNAQGYRIDMGNVPPAVLQERWPVATFPAASRKTIETKLNGHIFHPDLVHHFVDHFLGLYVSRKQPNVGLAQFSGNTAWTAHVPGDHCDRSRDNLDSVMFCKLAAQFIQNPSAYNYTDPLRQ